MSSVKSILMSLAASIPAVSPAAETTVFHSQPSAVLSTAQVELAVTVTGGQMAPVTFFRNSTHPVRPYHISPWQDEKPVAMPAPVLKCLRGDFFCMPFGGNQEAVAGETHPPHGEIVGEPWTIGSTTTSGLVRTLSMTFDTKIRKGRVTKELSLVEGENVIYSKHTIEGFAGRVPLGHHATLAMPDKEGSVRISTSPVRFGMTCAGLFSNPRNGEYQALQPGQKWTDLTKVPMAWKGAPDADLTKLPAGQGFADLIQIFPASPGPGGEPAWITATVEELGYVWFALKDPEVLRSTVFWMENRGRHGFPWNGRNNCLGLEDVTACFADGLQASINENVLTKEGIATALTLTAEKPTVVNYIQGVVQIPAGFGMVKTLGFAPGKVTFLSSTGQQVTAPVRHEFLKTGRLQ